MFLAVPPWLLGEGYRLVASFANGPARVRVFVSLSLFRAAGKAKARERGRSAPAVSRRVLLGCAAMPTSIDAHITGTVWKIEVKQGEAVTEGQVCVILESMKMEMPVEAPAAGTVDQILVKEGQPVSEGDTLLTLAASA